LISYEYGYRLDKNLQKIQGFLGGFERRQDDCGGKWKNGKRGSKPIKKERVFETYIVSCSRTDRPVCWFSKMTLKFDYVKFQRPVKSKVLGPSAIWPIIDIELATDTKSLRYSALVDSGADFCIFDAEIGENLGIDVRSGHKELFGGIQKIDKQAEAFFHPIQLIVGGKKSYTMVSFSYDIGKSAFGVLGQVGFFDLFIVKFDFKKERVELTERPA